jgi:hypothetical protein
VAASAAAVAVAAIDLCPRSEAKRKTIDIPINP